jgi:hypothetical protein
VSGLPGQIAARKLLATMPGLRGASRSSRAREAVPA